MNEIIVTLGDQKREVKILSESVVMLDGKENEYDLIILDSKSYLIKFNKKVYKVSVSRLENNKFSIMIDGFVFETIARTGLEEKASAIIGLRTLIKHKTDVKAPMPGMILKILRTQGEKISQGETVVILEAMKMENDLRSPSTGIIKDVFVHSGDKVEKGAMLFSIE